MKGKFKGVGWWMEEKVGWREKVGLYEINSGRRFLSDGVWGVMGGQDINKSSEDR